MSGLQVAGNQADFNARHKLRASRLNKASGGRQCSRWFANYILNGLGIWPGEDVRAGECDRERSLINRSAARPIRRNFSCASRIPMRT